MSYAFDSTMSAMNGPDQNQQNIFQPAPGSQAQAPVASGDQNIGQSTGLVTSGAQTVGGGTGTGASSAPGSPQQQSQQNSDRGAAQSSLFAQNAGRSKGPADLDALQSGISKQSSDLQNEANSYVQGATNLYGGGKIDSGTQSNINDFISSGAMPAPSPQTQAGVTPTPSWLSLFTGGPQKVDALNLQTDTTASVPTSLLATNAGIGQLYRQTASPEYTAGQAALDTQLLTQQPGFAQARSNVLGAEDALQAQRAGIIASAPDQAQKARDAAMAQWKGAVTGQLQAGAAGYQTAAQGEADQWNKTLAALQNSGTEQQLAQQAEGGITDPNLQPYLNGAMPQDLSKYFTATPGGASWQQFVTAPQATAYNAIEGALGAGGSALPGAGSLASGSMPTAADAYTFNKSGFQNDVIAAAQASLKRSQDLSKAAAVGASRHPLINTAVAPTATPNLTPVGAIGINTGIQPPTAPGVSEVSGAPVTEVLGQYQPPAVRNTGAVGTALGQDWATAQADKSTGGTVETKPWWAQ